MKKLFILLLLTLSFKCYSQTPYLSIAYSYPDSNVCKFIDTGDKSFIWINIGNFKGSFELKNVASQTQIFTETNYYPIIKGKQSDLFRIDVVSKDDSVTYINLVAFPTDHVPQVVKINMKTNFTSK